MGEPVVVAAADEVAVDKPERRKPGPPRSRSLLAAPHLWDATAEMRRLTDEDIVKCAPVGFELTPMMIEFVRAHAEGGAETSLASICKSIGLPEGTAKGWLKRLQPLSQTIETAALKYCGKQCVLVWRAVLAKATRGDLAAAKMFLLRFDLEFRMASHKQQVAEMSFADRSSLEKLTIAPAAPAANAANSADISVTDAAVANANVYAFAPAAKP